MRQRLLQLLSTCAALAAIACVEPPPYPTIIKAEVSTDAQARDADADDAIAPDDASHQDLAAPVPGVCEALECPGAPAPCTVVAAVDGSPCEDGDPCTVDDTCLSGTCTAGLPAYREQFFGGDDGESAVLTGIGVDPSARLTLAGALRSAGGGAPSPVVFLEGPSGVFEAHKPSPDGIGGAYLAISGLHGGAMAAMGPMVSGSKGQVPDEVMLEVLSPAGELLAHWDTREILSESVEAGALATSPSGAILASWRSRPLTQPLAPSLTARLTLTSYAGFLSPPVTTETWILSRPAARVDVLARSALGGYFAAGRFVDPPSGWIAWLDETGEPTCAKDIGDIDIVDARASAAGGAVVFGSVPLAGAQEALYVASFDADCVALQTWTGTDAPFAEPSAVVALGGERWAFLGFTETFEPSHRAEAGVFSLDLSEPAPAMLGARAFHGSAVGGDWSVWGLFGGASAGASRVAAVGFASDPTGMVGRGWLVDFRVAAPAECWPAPQR